MNKVLLVLIVLFHYVVFVSFVLTTVLSLFELHWYIAIAMNALIFRVIFSPTACPLTTIENVYRKKLGMSLSRVFMKEYLLNPVITWKKLLKFA